MTLKISTRQRLGPNPIKFGALDPKQNSPNVTNFSPPSKKVKGLIQNKNHQIFGHFGSLKDLGIMGTNTSQVSHPLKLCSKVDCPKCKVIAYHYNFLDVEIATWYNTP